MRNYVSSTSSTSTTVHAAANTFQARWACKPRVDLTSFAAARTPTDAAVTCGNCLRRYAAVWTLAHEMVAAMAEGQADAERQVAHDVQHGHVDLFASAPVLRRVINTRRGSVSYWFGRGDVQGVNAMAYSLRQGELQLAHWTVLATAAELEAYATRPCSCGGSTLPEWECELLSDHREVAADLAVLWDAALVMNRELDLAKDDAFERPEAEAFSVADRFTDEELAGSVQRTRPSCCPRATSTRSADPTN